MAKKKGKKKGPKRAWTRVTRSQAVKLGISFGEVGCELGLNKAALRKARAGRKK